MAANPSDEARHFFSLDEYFALEHAGDARYEYWGGDVVCMSGGTLAHGMITANVHQCLGRRLTGSHCRSFTADMAIKTPMLPPYRYPDASVVCGQPLVENIRGVDALLNPVLIVEVISPTTESRDRGEKFKAYQEISTFREYLLVAQQSARIIHRIRRADGVWAFEEISGTREGVRLATVDCLLPLAEIYDGVAFGAEQ